MCQVISAPHDGGHARVELLEDREPLVVSDDLIRVLTTMVACFHTFDAFDEALKKYDAAPNADSNIIANVRGWLEP